MWLSPQRCAPRISAYRCVQAVCRPISRLLLFIAAHVLGPIDLACAESSPADYKAAIAVLDPAALTSAFMKALSEQNRVMLLAPEKDTAEWSQMVIEIIDLGEKRVYGYHSAMGKAPTQQTDRLQVEIGADRKLSATFKRLTTGRVVDSARGADRVHGYRRLARCAPHGDRDDATFRKNRKTGTLVKFNSTYKALTNIGGSDATFTFYCLPMSSRLTVDVRIPPRHTLFVDGELLRRSPIEVTLEDGRTVSVEAWHGCEAVAEDCRVVVHSVLHTAFSTAGSKLLRSPDMTGRVAGTAVGSLPPCPAVATHDEAGSSSSSAAAGSVGRAGAAPSPAGSLPDGAVASADGAGGAAAAGEKLFVDASDMDAWQAAAAVNPVDSLLLRRQKMGE